MKLLIGSQYVSTATKSIRFHLIFAHSHPRCALNPTSIGPFVEIKRETGKTTLKMRIVKSKQKTIIRGLDML